MGVLSPRGEPGPLRLLLFLCVAGCLAFVAGCGRAGPSVRVEGWTLTALGRSTELTLPRHYGELLPEREIPYTLHADVPIPPELLGRELSLCIPFFTGIVALDVGGKRVPSIDPDRVEVFRSRGPHTWSIPRELTTASPLALDLRVRHAWSGDAYFDTIPRLILAGDRDLQTDMVRTTNDLTSGFALVALIQIGLTYLAIFLVDRRRKAYLWFAIQALTASYYHLFVSGLSQLVLRRYDVSMLALMLTAATFAAVRFCHLLFDLRPPSRWWTALFGANVVVGALSLGPWRAQPVAGKLAVATVAIIIAYHVVILTPLSFGEGRKAGGRIVLASWIVLVVAASFDSVSWLGLGEPLGGIRTGCVGLSVFAILQSLLLSREHISTLNRSDELNGELAARVALLEANRSQIQLLNDELRRQIADRSQQLFAALALASGRSEDVAELAPGDTLHGRYTVVRKIGEGGMGAVYEVVRATDGRHLALKVTRGRDGISLARLAREAQIAAQLTHPNIVAIVDVDVAPLGFLYIAMEFVRGPSLADEKAKYGDVAWAVAILRQVAEGLDGLHAVGIVHRDLKPGNVLMTYAAPGALPQVKISDFGISRLTTGAEVEGPHLDITRSLGAAGSDTSIEIRREAPTVSMPASSEARAAALDAETKVTTGRSGESVISASGAGSSSSLTEAGHVVGTPRYMAPELATEVPVLHASSDLFSLGIMAFQILAQKYPFPEPPALARIEERAVPQAVTMGTLRPDLDPALAHLVDTCLSLDPLARPTARFVADQLAALSAAPRRASEGGSR